MDFGLSEDQLLLQQSARDFLGRECAPAFVRELMDPKGNGHSTVFHAKLAKLGWTGLLIPPEYDGMGLRLLDLAVLAEEMGRVAMPGPFFSTSLLAVMALLQGSEDLRREWLPKISAGEAIGTLAWLEASDRLDAAGITLECKKTPSGYRLDGVKMFVTDAQVADFIVVAARSGSPDTAVSLLLVPRHTPGISIVPLQSIDQTRRSCEVVFQAVDVAEDALLIAHDKGWDALSRIQSAACIFLAADSLGGAEKSLELAVEYSKTRQQFGKPIGSFQAVKHMAAEMVAEIEPARSLVWYAAYAFDHEPEKAARAASLAKARWSDVYSRVTNRAVQIHGGIGFTWEHDMHLWFKRAKWNEHSFGDATFHREALANLEQW